MMFAALETDLEESIKEIVTCRFIIHGLTFFFSLNFLFIFIDKVGSRQKKEN